MSSRSKVILILFLGLVLALFVMLFMGLSDKPVMVPRAPLQIIYSSIFKVTNSKSKLFNECWHMSSMLKYNPSPCYPVILLSSGQGHRDCICKQAISSTRPIFIQAIKAISQSMGGCSLIKVFSFSINKKLMSS